jgi:hypothetical protein
MYNTCPEFEEFVSIDLMDLVRFVSEVPSRQYMIDNGLERHGICCTTGPWGPSSFDTEVKYI